jgi:uncharacterized protein with PIN domain
VQDGDRICVYRIPAHWMLPALGAIAANAPGRLRFVADSHLGGLARLLRMLGFDTLYNNAYHDSEVRRLAREEDRLVLTRDRDLLMCRDVTHGCSCIRCVPRADRRVVSRLRRCPTRSRSPAACTAMPAVPVDKAAVVSRIPPNAANFYDRFATCPACGHIYWEGSLERMSGLRTRQMHPRVRPGRKGLNVAETGYAVIVGAAGRDFHDFNVVFRADPASRWWPSPPRRSGHQPPTLPGKPRRSAVPQESRYSMNPGSTTCAAGCGSSGWYSPTATFRTSR